MWPCKNKGEDARLYKAVKAVSEFAIDLGINVPTGKDSLSMKQKYPNEDVISPGTVVISAAANCNDITKVVEPVFKTGLKVLFTTLTYRKITINLGGSLRLHKSYNKIGNETPTITNAANFKNSI